MMYVNCITNSFSSSVNGQIDGLTTASVLATPLIKAKTLKDIFKKVNQL